jgi:hypothetical protein
LLENSIITKQKEVFIIIIACRIIHLGKFLTQEQRKNWIFFSKKSGNPRNSIQKWQISKKKKFIK